MFRYPITVFTAIILTSWSQQPSSTDLERLIACIATIENNAKDTFPHFVLYKVRMGSRLVLRLEYCEDLIARHQMIKSVAYDPTTMDVANIEMDVCRFTTTSINNGSYWANISNSTNHMQEKYLLERLENVNDSVFPFANPIVDAFSITRGLSFGSLLEHGDYSLNSDEKNCLTIKWRGKRFWDERNNKDNYRIEATFDIKNGRCMNHRLWSENDPEVVSVSIFTYPKDDEDSFVPSRIQWGIVGMNPYHETEVIHMKKIDKKINEQCYLKFYNIQEPTFFERSREWSVFQLLTGLLLLIGAFFVVFRALRRNNRA